MSRWCLSWLLWLGIFDRKLGEMTNMPDLLFISVYKESDINFQIFREFPSSQSTGFQWKADYYWEDSFSHKNIILHSLWLHALVLQDSNCGRLFSLLSKFLCLWRHRDFMLAPEILPAVQLQPQGLYHYQQSYGRFFSACTNSCFANFLGQLHHLLLTASSVSVSPVAGRSANIRRDDLSFMLQN